MTVIAVSDIHGSMSVLGNLRRMQARYPEAMTVFCGDYVDGHEHGAAVLQAVQRQVADKRAIAILGNHDQMFIDYMDNPQNREPWLENGGDRTIAEMVRAATGRMIPADSDGAYHDMVDNYSELRDFAASLPTICVYGRILFIHAGLDLNKAEPLRDTSALDRIWIREDYIYRADRSEPIFAHNPLDYTLVTGHTPTGLIAGRFDGTERVLKNEFPKCPIVEIRYPDESPRYFIDGGAHSNLATNHGNIAVFDETTGELIDKMESNA